MSREDWADPTLADLVAPPVVVTVFITRAAEAAAIRRQPGRHRAPGGPRVPADTPTWRDLAGALARA